MKESARISLFSFVGSLENCNFAIGCHHTPISHDAEESNPCMMRKNLFNRIKLTIRKNEEAIINGSIIVACGVFHASAESTERKLWLSLLPHE